MTPHAPTVLPVSPSSQAPQGSKPRLADIATSPFQDSWLSGKWLPRSPWARAPAEEPATGPTTSGLPRLPPLFLPGLRSDPMGPPPAQTQAPIAEPERPEAVRDPVRDIEPAGDAPADPDATMELAPRLDSATLFEINKRNGGSFEEFAYPWIRAWARRYGLKHKQYGEQEHQPGAFRNVIPEAHIMNTEGLFEVILDAKAAKVVPLEQARGYVDLLAQHDPNGAPGLLIYVYPAGSPKPDVSAVRKYIKGDPRGKNEWERSPKKVEIRFLPILGWSGDLDRFRGEQ
jgi:hypothetical protein